MTTKLQFVDVGVDRLVFRKLSVCSVCATPSGSANARLLGRIGAAASADGQGASLIRQWVPFADGFGRPEATRLTRSTVTVRRRASPKGGST